MEIPKPTDEDKVAFRALIPQTPTVQVKAMFGNLGAFVNGNMFAGLFGASLGVRLLDGTRRAALLNIDGTGLFGPAGRPMGGYTALPSDRAIESEKAEPWIAAALADLAALPPKTSKTALAKRRRAGVGACAGVGKVAGLSGLVREHRRCNDLGCAGRMKGRRAGVNRWLKMR